MLIANVIGLMEVGSADALAVAISGWIIVPLLANIVFILITWRWRHEGKAGRRITGVFD